MSEKTETEHLRKLLDERGVEHYDHENDEPLRDEPDLATSWRMGGASVCAVPDKNGTFDLWIDHVTTEQAIVATLGRGKCHNTQTDFDFQCSECGQCLDNERMLGVRYCPRCGRKVVDE